MRSDLMLTSKFRRLLGVCVPDVPQAISQEHKSVRLENTPSLTL